jgi:hypothetical protein
MSEVLRAQMQGCGDDSQRALLLKGALATHRRCCAPHLQVNGAVRAGCRTVVKTAWRDELAPFQRGFAADRPAGYAYALPYTTATTCAVMRAQHEGLW